MERSHNLQGMLILLIAAGIAGVFLWQNSQPDIRRSVPVLSPTPHDLPPQEWEMALQTQIAAAAPLPTPDMQLTPFVPPTLPPAQNTEVVVAPVQLQSTARPSLTPRPTEIRPTFSAATPYPSPTGVLVAEDDSGNTQNFQPPPEQGPLSLNANDHFWLERPVDASANSSSLFYYTFGSNGPADEWRVHHGVDMPNPIGEPVHAGAAGTVVFAGDATQAVNGSADGIYGSYGNVVVIQHDMGYRGLPIWTLYAHNSVVLVEQGQHVEAGDILALSGGTGDVSGPHVHLEVRIGQNSYYTVYNPLLWIVPYRGYGVVAGRVTDPDGRFVDDISITLVRNGRVFEATSTYVRPKAEDSEQWEVVPDPAWQENFVIADVPEGDYQIVINLEGRRIERKITVRAGTTNFIALGIDDAATPQPVLEGG